MTRAVLMIIVVAMLAVFACPATAQENTKTSPEAVRKAIEKGAEWLKKQQKPDGSFEGTGELERDYPGGTTALALLALLRTGRLSRNDPICMRGHIYLKSKVTPEYSKVYSVSLALMVMEAYCVPNIQKQDSDESTVADPPDPPEKTVKNIYKKFLTKSDRKWMEDLTKWLLEKRADKVWRYPGAAEGKLAGDEDLSNTHYAVLALNAARRLGLKIGSDVWLKVADYCLEHQERHGKRVDSFKVAAADFEIKELRKIRDRYLRDLKETIKAYNKEIQDAVRKGKKPESLGFTRENCVAKVVKPSLDSRRHDMRARGWAYLPENQPYTGSMTASGVTILAVCKDALESAGKYRKVEKDVDQAIRDGCAWLAENFTVEKNPGDSRGYLYYYLASLEHAGAHCMLRRFGEHDWYEEGAKYLLAKQAAGGSWPSLPSGSALTNTCFAMLFLSKATIPLVSVPDQEAYPGSDIFDGVGGGK